MDALSLVSAVAAGMFLAGLLFVGAVCLGFWMGRRTVVVTLPDGVTPITPPTLDDDDDSVPLDQPQALRREDFL